MKYTFASAPPAARVVAVAALLHENLRVLVLQVSHLEHQCVDPLPEAPDVDRLEPALELHARVLADTVDVPKLKNVRGGDVPIVEGPAPAVSLYPLTPLGEDSDSVGRVERLSGIDTGSPSADVSEEILEDVRAVAQLEEPISVRKKGVARTRGRGTGPCRRGSRHACTRSRSP